jgi:hypothetical protein
VNEDLPPVSASADGSRFLIGRTVFSGQLAVIQEIHPEGYVDGPTVISPDATTAFFAVASGCTCTGEDARLGHPGADPIADSIACHDSEARVEIRFDRDERDRLRGWSSGLPG